MKPISQKRAFTIPYVWYEFNVLLFGLCSAPATFQGRIESILRGWKWKTRIRYLDDIVIFSSTSTEHIQRLHEVVTCPAQASHQLHTKNTILPVYPSKPWHVVRKEGIRPDPEKINAVLNFSRPLSQEELPSFLVLASCFLRLIRNFATMAFPPNKLLTSGSPFLWTENGETPLKTLKDSLTSGPVLCHVDESAPRLFIPAPLGMVMVWSFSNAPMAPRNVFSSTRTELSSLLKRTIP